MSSKKEERTGKSCEHRQIVVSGVARGKEVVFTGCMAIDYSAIIIAWQRKLGWTQRQLADASGRQESEVSRWVRGVQRPTMQSLESVAAGVGVDIITLLSINLPPRECEAEDIAFTIESRVGRPYSELSDVELAIFFRTLLGVVQAKGRQHEQGEGE